MDLPTLDKANQIVENRLIKDVNGQCDIYTGPQKNKYGLVKLTFMGNKLSLYAHRVAKMHSMGVTAFEPFLKCSHLCHNTLCCNPAHIVLEVQGINNNRQNCKTRRICAGHASPEGDALPACIFF